MINANIKVSIKAVKMKKIAIQNWSQNKKLESRNFIWQDWLRVLFRLLYAFTMEKFHQLKVGFSNVEIAIITILMLKVVL